ncbi:hypothetical protein CSA37_06350 [Candidatus Fermentibacteria bacterium]|nr:MAG: hypothetical protein CSA37_06350 [Candidatus Fermentibacteria bacterium]
MEEFIAKLLDLQDIDRKIDRLRSDIDSIPGEIEIHRKDTLAHTEKFQVFEDKLEGVRREQKDLASERAGQKSRIANCKSRLLELKSNEEYSAMLKQIAHCEKMIDQIDSRIIEAMYEEDKASEEMDKARKERDRAVSRSEAREQKLREKLAEMESEFEELKKLRAEASEKVDPRYLKRYEKARATGHREAVTGIRNGACGSCLTKIPAQSAGEIKGGITFACPICGSFVVWTDDSSLQ